MNKKGDVGSIIIIIATILIAGVIFLLITTFQKDILGDMLQEEDLLTTQANETLTDFNDNVSPINDNLIFWFFIAMCLGLLVSSVFLGFHPVTMIIFGLLLIMAVFLHAEAVNIYDEFATDDTLSTDAQSLTLTKWIVFSKYSPLILAVFGIISLVIMFSKRNTGGYY